MLFDVKINDLTLLITEDTLQKSVYLETLLWEQNSYLEVGAQPWSI